MGGCLAKEDGNNSRGSAVVPYSSPPAKKAGSLRLYATETCPLACSIRIALEFKGVPVQVFWLKADDDLARTTQLLQYMLPAADAGLPILQHANRTIPGSDEDILAYIEAAFPKPSLRGGNARKDVQNWADFARDSFGPIIMKALYNSDLAPQYSIEKQLDVAFAKLNSAMAKHASKGPYFLGSQFSLVDVHLIPLLALAGMLAYAQGIEMSSDYGHLRSYATRMAGFAGYSPVRMDAEMLKDHVCEVIARNAPPPLVVMTMLQHQSMLGHFEKLVLALDEMIASISSSKTAIDPAKGSMAMQIKKLSAQYACLLELMLEHAQMEERVIFPPLEKADRDITSSATHSHARHLPLMNGIKEDFKAVVSFDNGSPGVKEALQAIASRLRTLQAHNVEHFREEEAELLPLLKAAGLGSKQQGALVGKCMEIMESTHGQKSPFLLSGLRPHQIHRYLNLLQQQSVESARHVLLKKLMLALKQASDNEEYTSVWQTVKCRMPALASMATS